jgi:hypothetical protein
VVRAGVAGPKDVSSKQNVVSTHFSVAAACTSQKTYENMTGTIWVNGAIEVEEG